MSEKILNTSTYQNTNISQNTDLNDMIKYNTNLFWSSSCLFIYKYSFTEFYPFRFLLIFVSYYLFILFQFLNRFAGQLRFLYLSSGICFLFFISNNDNKELLTNYIPLVCEGMIVALIFYFFDEERTFQDIKKKYRNI